MPSRLGRTREFANYLSHKDSTLSEILNYLVRVILPSLHVDSAIFLQSNNFGEFLQVANSGLSNEGKLILREKYLLSEKFPGSKAIQTGEIVWLSVTSNKRDHYPLLKNHKAIVGSKSIIAIPVWIESTPDAAIVLFSKENLEESPETKAFLQAISSIFSLHHYRKIVVSPDENPPSPQNDKNELHAIDNELTERQILILKLISEERTNLSISEFLGYSESTIRQEIIKIFDKLGCSTRSEASAIYKSYSKAS